MAPDIIKMKEIKFHIQDVEHIVKTDEINPNKSLNTYIRETLQLTGTKYLCLEGGCGSCVVVRQSKDPVSNKDVYMAVNSCLIPILSCNDWKIYTVEGIGNPLHGHHPVQEVLAKFNGTQCGFCSPGMVMNMYALYQSGKLTMKEVENSFGGNLCRCTGYRPILSAFKSLCTDASSDILGKYPDIEDLRVCRKEKCEATCAQKCQQLRKEPFYLQLGKSVWVKVFTIDELLKTLQQNSASKYRLVDGNTAKGVFGSYGSPYDVYIDISGLTELKQNNFSDNSFVVGANTTLTTAMEIFEKTAKEKPQFFYLADMVKHIDLVANVPVRNVGSIAGNLMMKHDYNDFPSDIFLILETVGATLTVVGVDKTEVKLSPKDFTKYDMNLKILKNIILPSYDSKIYKYVSYKIMPRAQNVHAIVNAGFLFKLNQNQTLDTATIVIGNINRDFIHATKTENLLKGKQLFDNTVLQQAFATLSSELVPHDAPPDPAPEFRKQLAVSLFYKAVLNIAPPEKITPIYQSGGSLLTRPVSTGVQDYETKQSLYPLTQPISKIEALEQTSGQAQYINDMPDLPHQLFGKLILAKAPPNSIIKKIDASKAKAVEGVEAFYGKDDIPGENNFTPLDLIVFSAPEEVFCSGRVMYYDQPIGILVGKDIDAVTQAANLVEVTYDHPNESPILSVRDVLKKGKTDRIKVMKEIKPKRKGANIKRVIKGTFDIYQQYHFHMETQCCNAIPVEGDKLDIWASTQCLDATQLAVANVLKIPNNKINVTVRRLGGGFGGKISRNGLVACAAALASWKLRKPVKLSLSLSDNMASLGKRWPLSIDYEVGVDDHGVIQYLNSSYYTDMGAIRSEIIVIEELYHMLLKTYDIDTFNITLHTAITDTPANTWARGPGTTESLASLDCIMEHIAYELNADPLAIKIANFAKNAEVRKYIDELKTWAEIDKRKKEIAAFNKANRWKKKGMAIVPLSYTFELFGPWSAQVSIFHGDGSVQISHGGIEMGQGINTKAAQVCAYKLGIPLEKVAVVPSQSFINPNNFFTGGSLTSEAVCYGIIDACDQLLARIQPHRKAGDSWEQAIKKCFENAVHLNATGTFSRNDKKVSGYMIYGVCAAEALVDVLTGQYLISRVDLIEDVGQSMSPEIDIGQIEGAFVMGMGLYTTEKIVFNNEGKLLTHNTWTYHPPGAKDIPIDFRVQIKKNNPNPVGVLKSKAVAEPPLCMSVSVPLAIRNAVASARADANPSNPKWYPFDGPTDVENVFMNSMNNFTQYKI